jgi:urease accessory protein
MAGAAESSLRLVRAPVAGHDAALPEVGISVDRRKLARRLWRGRADDGVEFGFEVSSPLRHGDVVAVDKAVRYVIRQSAEPLLEIPLDVSQDAAAVIGWAVGNLHFAIEARSSAILAPDDPGLRRTLEQLGVHFHEVVDVFQPHRFSGSLAGHGHGHAGDQHSHA